MQHQQDQQQGIGDGDLKPVFQVVCKAQNYPWGKLGSSSAVARFAGNTPKGTLEVDPKQPYAELWLGSTHKHGPSSIHPSGRLLRDVTSEHPDFYLGRAATHFKSTDVPFLFKILCCREALPIQAHPDKALGERLHREDPSSYVDTNHKPEVGLAIAPFEAFAGFKPLSEIAELVDRVHELHELALDEGTSGKDYLANADEKEFKEVLNRILATPQDTVKRLAESALANMDKYGIDKQYKSLFQRCNDMYPGDVGSFVAVFFMNHLAVDAGKCIWVPEDGIHAWLQGDIIECMAVSDNVVNSGFIAPKERDRKLFMEMIRYNPSKAEDNLLEPSAYGQHSKLYSPPIEEFKILATTLKAGQSEEIAAHNGPAVLIVTNGSGELQFEHSAAKNRVTLEYGKVLFIAPGTKTVLSGDLEVHRAFCDLNL